MSVFEDGLSKKLVGRRFDRKLLSLAGKVEFVGSCRFEFKASQWNSLPVGRVRSCNTTWSCGKSALTKGAAPWWFSGCDKWTSLSVWYNFSWWGRGHVRPGRAPKNAPDCGHVHVLQIVPKSFRNIGPTSGQLTHWLQPRSHLAPRWRNSAQLGPQLRLQNGWHSGPYPKSSKCRLWLVFSAYFWLRLKQCSACCVSVGPNLEWNCRQRFPTCAALDVTWTSICITLLLLGVHLVTTWRQLWPKLGQVGAAWGQPGPEPICQFWGLNATRCMCLCRDQAAHAKPNLRSNLPSQLAQFVGRPSLTPVGFWVGQVDPRLSSLGGGGSCREGSRINPYWTSIRGTSLLWFLLINQEVVDPVSTVSDWRHGFCEFATTSQQKWCRICDL